MVWIVLLPSLTFIDFNWRVCWINLFRLLKLFQNLSLLYIAQVGLRLMRNRVDGSRVHLRNSDLMGNWLRISHGRLSKGTSHVRSRDLASQRGMIKGRLVIAWYSWNISDMIPADVADGLVETVCLVLWNPLALGHAFWWIWLLRIGKPIHFRYVVLMMKGYMIN